MEYIIAAVTLAALPFTGLAVGACLVMVSYFHHTSRRH